MEWCLSGCCGDKVAAKWAFVLATLGTSLFPLADFVSDIFVAHEFYTAEDPAEQYWGKLSVGIISVSSFLSLAFFWGFIDIFGGERVWSSHYGRNVLIGFVLTATNLRAQAMACIMLWRLLAKGEPVEDLKGDPAAGASGIGAGATTLDLTMVKLLEFFFETIPELLLQGYALLYRHHVDGAGMADGNALLLASLSISFATLVSGLTATFLGANDAAVMALGAAYFLCIVFGRMALFGLLFLQFGQLAAIFASAALLLRIAYVVCADRLRGVDDDARLLRSIFDAPTLVIVPVGMNTGGKTDVRTPRALRHLFPEPASVVLYGPDARWSLAMHVAEAAVGAVLLHTCGGRSVAPYRAAGHAAGSGPGNGGGGGSAGPAEVELVVEPADILWYIVGPYCAGLAVLALLVVVDTVNWDDVWPLHSSYKRRSKQYAAQKKTPEEAAASEVSPVEIAAARVVSPVWVTTV